MTAIQTQARAIVRDLDDIKESLLQNSALRPTALAARLIEVKRAAARLADCDTVEQSVMAGYRGDVHQELQSLYTLIEQRGFGVLVMNRRDLQLVALAAENFAERARNYLRMADEHEEIDNLLTGEFIGGGEEVDDAA
jgi:hypothetical protein